MKIWKGLFCDTKQRENCQMNTVCKYTHRDTVKDPAQHNEW